MAGNPRIDDLRKRLEKEPGSRLFAQLAEELRKEGDLADAIRISRDGLQKHTNYPSARMTLGRALLDTGDYAAARLEFEAVLKGAPDNILASRFLAESLEGLGDVAAALERYRLTLAMAPGDKNVSSRIEALETAPAPAAAASGAPPAFAVQDRVIDEGVPAPDPAPIPLVDADEEFELERPSEAPVSAWKSPAVAAPPPPPAPVAAPSRAPEPAIETEFELEQPSGAPGTAWRSAAAAPQPPPVTARATAPEPVVETEFELEQSYGAPPARWVAPAVESSPAAARVVSPADLPPPVAVTPEERPRQAQAAAPSAPEAPAEPQQREPEIASATLAELYFNQGFTDKAIDVYRQVLEREPGNGRIEARIMELERLERHLRAEAAPAAAAPRRSPRDERSQRDEKRQRLEQTITRLEGLMHVMRGGKP